MPRPLCESRVFFVLFFFYPIPTPSLPDPRPAHQVVLVWAELPQAGIPDIPDLQLCPSPLPPSSGLAPFPCLSQGIRWLLSLCLPFPSLVIFLLCLLSARSNYQGLPTGSALCSRDASCQGSWALIIKKALWPRSHQSWEVAPCPVSPLCGLP